MPDGLFELPVALLAGDAALTAEMQPLIGLIAAALGAALAGSASWYVTDRLVAWRRRADRDEL